MMKLKFKSDIFKSFNKSNLIINFSYNSFYNFVPYIDKCLKTYQLNIIKKIKKRLRKKLVKYSKVFLKKNAVNATMWS